MDEAEKYQQRLQAIAEKRRLQEEQERVKREMEEERIRLQQLKRKSLRDQWLMEGPPLSPDSTGPRSPLWGPQAQEIEQNIDSLQAKNEQLTEEVGKLTEDGVSIAAVSDGLAQGNSEGIHILEDGRTEDPTAKETVLQNGQGNGTTEEGAEEYVKATSSSLVMAEESGPNGEVATDVPATEEQGQIEGNLGDAVTMATSEAQEETPTSNGPATKPDDGNGAVTMTFLGFSDMAKGEGVDDDGGAIMRAERVIIISDEGEDEPESQTAASEAPAAETPAAPEEQEPEATGAKTPAAPEEQQPEATGAELQSRSDAPAEAEEATEAAEQEVEAAEKEKKGEGGETPSEAQAEPVTAEATAEATAAEEQPPPEPTEGAVVTSEVPVYSPAAEPAIVAEGKSQQPETSELKEGEGVEATVAAGSAPTASSAPETIPSSPGQFQDVPLDEAKPQQPELQVEQEPLLTSKTAPQTDTAAPRRAEGGDAPKRKTCQCCSVM